MLESCLAKAWSRAIQQLIQRFPKFLLPILWSLYKLLWSSCLIPWKRSVVTFGTEGFRAIVVTNPLGNMLSTIMTPVRLVVWLIVCFVILLLWLVALLGGIALVPLYVASLVLLASLVLVIWLFAVLYITSNGLVFLVGGAASILRWTRKTGQVAKWESCS